MSFCQKHQNHHCVHAHSCKNPEHSRNKSNNNNPRSTKKSVRDLRATTVGVMRMNKKLSKIQEEAEEECQFNGQSIRMGDLQNCVNCDQLMMELDKKSLENEELKKNVASLNKRNYKVNEQNRQLEGVLEYYRTEMDRIVKCNSGDLKQEIKKHLKQSKEQNLRIKFLTNKITGLETQLERLEVEDASLKKKLNEQRKEKDRICHNYDELFDQMRRLSTEGQKKESDLIHQRKKNITIEDRYQIVMDETRKKLDHNSREIRRLTNQNKEQSSEMEILQKKLENTNKLSQMDANSNAEREKLLLQKNQKLEETLKEVKNKNYSLQKENKFKNEQLQHYKKVIDKQIRQAKLHEQLTNHLDKHQFQDDGEGNKENENINNEYEFEEKKREESQLRGENVIKLEEEIRNLKEKIGVLQSKGHSSTTIEEYILTIGASEAFKRIIEEKNQYIKKLIREKGDLLNRI